MLFRSSWGACVCSTDGGETTLDVGNLTFETLHTVKQPVQLFQELASRPFGCSLCGFATPVDEQLCHLSSLMTAHCTLLDEVPDDDLCLGRVHLRQIDTRIKEWPNPLEEIARHAPNRTAGTSHSQGTLAAVLCPALCT